MKILQLDARLETIAEFLNNPGAGAVVNMARSQIDKESEPEKQAERDAGDVGPKARSSSRSDHWVRAKLLKSRDFSGAEVCKTEKRIS